MRTKYGAGDGSTTFNLPDLQHRVLEGTNTTSEVAQKVEAGLPDITGALFQLSSDVISRTGAFAGTKVTREKATTIVGSTQSEIELTFSAQSSNGVYGQSGTVQPNALRLLAIIRT